MERSTLKQRAVSGMAWAALQRYSTIFIHFVSGIILARLLTPYDYGCIGMLTIFMMLAQTFIDGGFGSALIQKKQPTQEDYSSIFWWNIGMALVMYAVLFASAPAIARFYKIPLLSKVLRVQGIVLFIYAFNIIQQNQLKKNLNFKLLAIVTIATSVIALSVTIWIAYRGFGVWALVVQNLLMTAIPAFVFWLIVKWRPLFAFSLQSFRNLFGFGFYMFMTQLINEFSRQIQGLIIGKVYNPATLGLYSKANDTERVASTSISQIITQVTYPLYAEVQDDKEKLTNIINRITSTLAYITFPILFLLILCAKPLFVILYSERWLQSVPYFQALCIAGFTICLQSVNLQVIAAIGKSKLMFKWAIIKRVTGFILDVGGLLIWGMKGLLCGVILHNIVDYVVNMGLVSKYIKYNWRTQLKHLFPIMSIAFAAFVISYVIVRPFALSLYIGGVVKITIYLTIYMGWSFIAKPESYMYCREAAMILIRRLQVFFINRRRRNERSA